MWRQDHVVEFAQRRVKRIAVGCRLRREHVDGRPRQMLTLQRVAQRRNIDHRTASGVDQQRARLHQRQLFRAHHVFGGGVFRHVQAHHVAHVQQVREMLHLRRVTQRQLAFNIVEVNVHPQRLRQDPQLGTDVAVADDTQFFTTGFV